MKPHGRKLHSPLLIDEDPLQVLPSLAVAVGLNEAIILNQLHYWLKKTSHWHDGTPWVFNSYKDWTTQFPFWSWRTIRAAILTLEHRGILLAANFNHNPIDKTKWYTIDYEVLNRFLPPTSHDETPSSADIPKTDIDIPNTVIDIPKTDIDIPNTVIDIPKTDIDIPKRESLARANLEFKQETTPETTPKEHTPPSPSAGERARDSPRHKHRTPRQKGYSEPFCTFYDAYLRHEDPDDAWKAWQSIDGDAHAEAIMAGVAAHYQANDAWKRREMRYVKKPAAWLRAGSYKSDFARSIKDEEEGRTRRLQLYKAIEEGQPL